MEIANRPPSAVVPGAPSAAPRGESLSAPNRLRRGSVNLDFVQGKMEFAGAFLTIPLAEFVLLALELHHLLMRRLQQAMRPIVSRCSLSVMIEIPKFGLVLEKAGDRGKVRCRRITEL